MNTAKRDTMNEYDNKMITKLFEKYFCDFTYILKEEDNPTEKIDMTASAYTHSNKLVTYDIEIKSRKEQIPNVIGKYDCYLEKKKFNSLYEYSNERKIYAVIYPKNNQVYIWNVGEIDNIEKYEKYKLLPEVTETGAETKKLVWKWVYCLPLEKGKPFQLSCNKEEYYANN